jgi:hypothetical protein
MSLWRAQGVPEFRSSGVQDGKEPTDASKKPLQAKMPTFLASLLLAPELLELLELLNSFTT